MVITTEKYFDRSICKHCKYYVKKEVYEEIKQVVDNFCCGCYGNKVFIVTRFERNEEINELDK